MNVALAIHGGKPVMVMPPRVNPIGPEEKQAIKRALDQGTISAFRGGPLVHQFEAAFAKYVGAKYAVATTSGTTALHASLAALHLKKGDEVLVPAMTFVSTASVVLQEGATVVFVDIDEYFGMDPADLRAKITPNSKAIIPVHLYGQPADMDAITEIAAENNLIIIEDACQAHGAELHAKKTGTLGDAGCFSFFETKNMTTGEGGMVTTSDPELYRKICLRREHGSPRDSKTWYAYRELGYNYNMTELQAAIGIVQLKKLDKLNAERNINAQMYHMHLAGLGLTLPKLRSGATSVYHNFPVLLPKKYRIQRGFFVDAMRAEGVPIDIAYPSTLYQTELFISRGIIGDCPHAEDYASRLFTLFTDSAITKTTITNTAKAIRKICDYLDEQVK